MARVARASSRRAGSRANTAVDVVTGDSDGVKESAGAGCLQSSVQRVGQVGHGFFPYWQVGVPGGFCVRDEPES